ncbi:anti-virulence regulator CigR family protein [Halomonas sp. C05BenzN]|uniref:anti-virulence regulator CigR family protein n=1 Tax=Halomonas sp. C05BenzN TaxID=3411041 RepID=UPI003B94603A
MRNGTTRPLLLASLLGLALAAGPVLAQPADNPGRGQGAGAREQPPGQRGEAPGRGASPQQERRDTERPRNRDYWRDRERERHGEGRVERRDGPRIVEGEVRRIFERHREFIRHDDRDGLPPGIRMNLERGKPLPPGIARNFDDRVLRDLPRHDGYRWHRVGPDAVLVDAANDVIHEVLRDILE